LSGATMFKSLRERFAAWRRKAETEVATPPAEAAKARAKAPWL